MFTWLCITKQVGFKTIKLSFLSAVFKFLFSKFTLPSKNISFVPFKSNHFWCFWTYIIVHEMARLNCNGEKSSPFYRQFWVGNVPCICMLLGKVLWASSDHCSTTTDNCLQKEMPKRQAVLHSAMLLETETPHPFLTSPEKLKPGPLNCFPQFDFKQNLPTQVFHCSFGIQLHQRPQWPDRPPHSTAYTIKEAKKRGDFSLTFTGPWVANIFSEYNQQNSTFLKYI